MNHIPKICHFFWDGAPMSIFQVFSVISFRKQNPDWTILVWRSKQKYTELGKNTFVGGYTGKDYSDILSFFPFVFFREVDFLAWKINTSIPACSSSDIFRMKVLYRYGGIYSDFDVLWVRPIRHLAFIDCYGDFNKFECSVCFYEYTKGFQNVSIMIAQDGSRYLKTLMDLQDTVQPPYAHQSYGSTLITNAFPTLESIEKEGYNVLAVKYETFYPYSIYELEKLFCKVDMTPMNYNVIAVHWFCGHEISLKCLNQDILQRESNSFTKIISQLFREAF